MSANSSPGAGIPPAGPAAGPGPLGFFASRHSVRDLLPGPLDPGVTARLLDIVCTAPSAHGAQPWRLVLVESPAARDRLAQALAERLEAHLARMGEPPPRGQRKANDFRRRIRNAPLAVLVCAAEEDLPDPVPGRDRAAERQLATQGAAVAAGWLLLAAHSLGLAACWYSAPVFVPRVFREVLHLPRSWKPQALILVGQPTRPAGPRHRRRTPSEVVVSR